MRRSDAIRKAEEIEGSNGTFYLRCSQAASAYHHADSGHKMNALFGILIPAILEEHRSFFGTDKRLYVYEEGAYRSDGITKLTPQLQNHPDLQNILHTNVYNELMNRLRRMTITPLEQIKAPEHLLCLMNGILDLQTGEIHPHSPDYRFTSRIPLRYDPNATCPKIVQFVTDVLGEEYLQTFYELAGHILSRKYYPHNAVMLLGAGRNGKGKMLNILRAWIGEKNTSGLTIRDLNHNFRVASLFGKHLNVCGDLDSKMIRETGMFKQLTGQDLVTAEFKGVDPFQFENYATMVFATNQLPPSVDRTDGFMRRWMILEFTRQFDGDGDNPNVDKEIIEDPLELSGLLNEAIQGLKRLKENGAFTQTKSIADTRQRYLRLSEPLRTFKSEMLEEDPNSRDVPKDEIFSAYTKFCAQERRPALAKNAFFRSLLQILTSEGWIIEDTRPNLNGTRTQCWNGLKIRTGEDSKREIPDIYDNPGDITEKTENKDPANPDKTLTTTLNEDQGNRDYPDTSDNLDRSSLDGAVNDVNDVKDNSCITHVPSSGRGAMHQVGFLKETLLELFKSDDRRFWWMHELKDATICSDEEAIRTTIRGLGHGEPELDKFEILV